MQVNLKRYWPLSEVVVKRIYLAGAVIGVAGGIAFMAAIMSLSYERLIGIFVFWIVVLIVGTIVPSVVMMSCIWQVRTERLGERNSKTIKRWMRLAISGYALLFLPFVFLGASQVWYENVGKAKAEALHRASNERTKQYFAARKAARERAHAEHK